MRHRSFSLRLVGELLAVAAMIRVAGWFAAAPPDADARAAYLCAPVRATAGRIARVTFAMRDDGSVPASAAPWRGEAYRTCTRFLVRVIEPQDAWND